MITIKSIRKNLINIPGWRTKRKIVVIESDDWGSIRMPSRDIYELLLAKGIPIEKHYFLRNDCLESEDDLNALFEVLIGFKDKNGNHPVITANSVVANPDFSKIEKNDFKEYYYETIIETYKSYYNNTNVMDLWLKKGIQKKLLWPQFHGREHLNAKKWLRVLRLEKEQEMLAFKNKVLLGISAPNSNRYNSYMAAFEYETEEDKDYIESMTLDGLNIFEKLFGFRTSSFVASQSIQGEHINPLLKSAGVLYHQLGQQFIPTDDGGLKVKNRFCGSKNESGQIYWRRNSTFEPAKNQDINWADSCLKEIKIAFFWGKPAVINSHRVNYIGSIFPENRNKSLIQLNELLTQILKLWPDVEFLTSDQLGDLISRRDETK